MLIDLDNLREITLSEGLELSYDIRRLIFGGKNDIYLKDSLNLEREFNIDKWGMVKKMIQDNKLADLKVIENLIESKNYIYIFYRGKHYLGPPNFLKISILTDLLESLKDFYTSIKFESLVEIGSGYGSKILSLAEENLISNNLKFIATDISLNGLSSCKILAKRMNLNIQTFHYDFSKNEIFPNELLSNSAIFSCYCLHYWESLTVSHIENFIKAGVKCGVHLEPCSDIYQNIQDPLYRNLAYKYMYLNDYLEGILAPFIKAKELGLIKLKVEENIIGSGLLPHSRIEWEVI